MTKTLQQAKAELADKGHIDAGSGSFRSREVTIHVPVGLRYQTAKLFTDGGYEEVEVVRQPINASKALSKDLGRTMPDYRTDLGLLYWYDLGGVESGTEGYYTGGDWEEGDYYEPADGYAMTFSKVTA